MTEPKLRSHWRVEIPQRRPKDSAQVHQTLSSSRVGSGDETRPCIIRAYNTSPAHPATSQTRFTPKKMATGRATGGIKIPSSGETTPEYNAVQKSYEEIEPAIIPDDFVRRARSCGILIPTRNSSNSPLEVVLNEISRHPVDYYSLQHVLATLNVRGRFDEGIGKMETTFQCNAPINIMPHYPPPRRYRGQHRGIDIENQAPDRGI